MTTQSVQLSGDVNKRDWHPVKNLLPDEDVKVMVIAPNGQELVMFRKGNPWFYEDGSMYVYWTPVFWHAKPYY